MAKTHVRVVMLGYIFWSLSFAKKYLAFVHFKVALVISPRIF